MMEVSCLNGDVLSRSDAVRPFKRQPVAVELVPFRQLSEVCYQAVSATHLPHIMNPSTVLAQSLPPRRPSMPVMDVGMVEPDWRHLVRRYHVSSAGPPGCPAGDLNHLSPEHSTVFGERVAPADGLHVTRTILYGNEHRAFPRPRECCPKVLGYSQKDISAEHLSGHFP